MSPIRFPGWDLVERLERAEKLGQELSQISNGLRQAPSADKAAAFHAALEALQKELAILSQYFTAASPAELYDLYNAVAEAIAGKPEVVSRESQE
jgi:sugar phosphate isomerase/epimerase